jgi:PPM family protein phosphatase
MKTTIRCPICGHENRGDARFCQGCGKPLPPGGAGAPKQATKPLTKSAAPQQASASDLPGTRPLPSASTAFAPLPAGALLREGRYLILEDRSTNEHMNLYLVEDTKPVRMCPNCQEEIFDPEEQFCFSCGADLSSVEPLHLRYLMQESADAQAFTNEAQLLGMNLDHPGLRLPHAIFTEAPYGPPRRYRVKPESAPPPASSLPKPQELHHVLEWGLSLAQALAYLHQHQVTLRECSLENILVDGKVAQWMNFGAARVISPQSRSESASYFVQDVQGLARALFHLATGKPRYTPDLRPSNPLPNRVAKLFSQALSGPPGIMATDFAASLEAALGEIRRPESVTLAIGSRTDVGQERSLNEDSLSTLDQSSVFRSVRTPLGLFVVADGMGGHEAGDAASRLAISTIHQQAVNDILTPASSGRPLPALKQWLTTAAQAANRAVYDERKAAGTDMGTTLVMAIFIGDKATIANVGDSRAYLLKQDQINQITTDHSLVERLVATGQITPQEALNHPQRNVIYRVIGDKPRLEVDIFEQRLAPGEALLLCSDGLSGMVTDEKIHRIWRTSTSPQDACDRLVEAANQAGGEDNITVVIVQVNRS